MTDVLLRGAEYIYQTHVVTKRTCPDFLSMGLQEMMLLKLTFARGMLYLSLLSKVKHGQRMMFFPASFKAFIVLSHRRFYLSVFAFLFYLIDYLASKLQITLKRG